MVSKNISSAVIFELFGSRTVVIQRRKMQILSRALISYLHFIFQSGNRKKRLMTLLGKYFLNSSVVIKCFYVAIYFIATHFNGFYEINMKIIAYVYIPFIFIQKIVFSICGKALVCIQTMNRLNIYL